MTIDPFDPGRPYAARLWLGLALIVGWLIFCIAVPFAVAGLTFWLFPTLAGGVAAGAGFLLTVVLLIGLTFKG